MFDAIMFAAVVASATGSPMSNHVVVSNGWFRALPAHLPAAGYFELRNAGSQTVTLIGADSPDCGMLMVHKSEQKNGTDSMADVPGVDIVPGQTVTFAPGGYHLMCTDPGPTVKPGGAIPLMLRFLDGSAAAMRLPVRSVTGQ